MFEAAEVDVEEAIRTCVREFYGEARQDPLLGPIFNQTVEDWDVHLRVIADFWSKVLLQTDRYKGAPFVLHRSLPVELEHFDRWLTLFEATVHRTLPTPHAEKALAKAKHMAESFKAGIFPFVDQNGRPARQPG
jgi:hemoglobin